MHNVAQVGDPQHDLHPELDSLLNHIETEMISDAITHDDALFSGMSVTRLWVAERGPENILDVVRTKLLVNAPLGVASVAPRQRLAILVQNVGGGCVRCPRRIIGLTGTEHDVNGQRPSVT